MIVVDVQTNIAEAVKALNLLPRQVDSAAARAINRAADAGRREAVQAITESTGESKEFVKGKTYVSGANRATLTARIGALPSASNVGLYRGANPENVVKHQTGGGTKVKGRTVQTFVRHGVELKAWNRRQLYDRAFTVAKGGRQRVVARRGGLLRGLWGPSVRKEFMRPKTLRRTLVKVYERFAREFATALKFYLK